MLLPMTGGVFYIQKIIIALTNFQNSKAKLQVQYYGNLVYLNSQKTIQSVKFYSVSLSSIIFTIQLLISTVTTRMKLRKCSEGTIQTSTTTTILQPFSLQVRPSTSKIIQSYEQLLQSLNHKIGQLTIDLQLTQGKLSVTETRYATLVSFLDDNGKINVEKLVDKVDELEKKFINQNAEIVRLKGKIMRNQAGKSCEINDNSSGVIRNDIGNYFNFERIRENEQIMKRQRRNSVEQQQNSIPWERALEQYSDNVSSPTKFKQKTLPILKKFIPHQQRHKIWPYVFENQLGITNSLFIELMERRNHNAVEPQVKSQIHRDIMRSFSCKMDVIFGNGANGSSIHNNNKEVISAQVQQVLQIFHLFRPDISYVQGMTYPVIILTIIVGKVEAFKIFCNLILCNKFFRNMYSFQNKSIQIYCKVFDQLLKQWYPEVSHHIQTLQIKSQLFLIEWFFTIFSRGLSLETTLKIWDLIGYQRQLVLYRICLAIFELIGKRLLIEKYEQTVGLIQSYWASVDENKLLQLVVNSKLGNEKLAKVFAKVTKEVYESKIKY